MVTSGPGSTNLITGIVTAFLDSSPVVAFTGQVAKSLIGKDAFQETDITGITTPVTKHNFILTNPSEVPLVVEAAFYIATTGRPGPVLVDIPKDIQVLEEEISFTKKMDLPGYKPNLEPHILQIKKAVELLKSAERPVILAGGGVIISNATHELMLLGERMTIPIATTLMGKGCIPENHPLSLGMVGMHGTPYANKTINKADVILAVGVRFSDRTTGVEEEFAKNAKIIHIDIDPAEIGKNVNVEIPIVGDAKKALKALCDNIQTVQAREDSSSWLKLIEELKADYKNRNTETDSLKPPRLLKLLRELLPGKTIVTTEVGQNQMWAALYFQSYFPRTFISSGGLGTMGFGFPAAIGAKVAKPNVPVVDIAGDGSFIMTEQELATSIEEKIPVIVIILNNRSLGMVAQWQRLFYNRRYSEIDLGHSPDFVKLAEAYGAAGLRAQSYEEFSSAVKTALRNEVTTVIDVPISLEENVYPMVPPGRGLNAILLGG
jgi:acetolactate synthase-1/2/3 large subunit